MHSPTDINVSATADVFAGLFDRAGLAAHLKRSERTIIRFERAGMPYVAVGRLRLYDPLKVRGWLLSHEHKHETPRRGRPSKAA